MKENNGYSVFRDMLSHAEDYSGRQILDVLLIVFSAMFDALYDTPNLDCQPELDDTQYLELCKVLGDLIVSVGWGICPDVVNDTITIWSVERHDLDEAYVGNLLEAYKANVPVADILAGSSGYRLIKG